ncbi:hypothetical protein [Sigmofec virus UA08Rod_6120]|uniref:Uncharacterized protein n=1 Tax=Sigmofec virus UA08Rod_6120 TaxID=2929453 RepID=A0A976R574_9VIRU|nr:hypothetical protein [Sigmofec virus UA08Rod_6120]
MLDLYALKDVLVGFQNPFVSLNRQTALRQLSLTVNAKDPNPIQATVQDVELWQIGTYDETTGTLVPKLEFVCRALDCVSGGADSV